MKKELKKIDEYFDLLEEIEDLEDKLDIINFRLRVMQNTLKYKETSFNESKKYNRNWVSDI